MKANVPAVHRIFSQLTMFFAVLLIFRASHTCLTSSREIQNNIMSEATVSYVFYCLQYQYNAFLASTTQCCEFIRRRQPVRPSCHISRILTNCRAPRIFEIWWTAVEYVEHNQRHHRVTGGLAVEKTYRKQDHHAADELDLYKSSSLDVS